VPVEAAAPVFSRLAIADPAELIYGIAPRPVTCGFGLTIGGGLVFPEVNFTLPAIAIEPGTWREIVVQYDEMAGQIIGRAVDLKVPGIVLEFELLPPMTDTPEWGAEIAALLHGRLEQAHERHGLRSALRVTPTDIREQEKPLLLRTGPSWDKLRRSFELCIAAGADIVSIESIGGKEVHDRALMYGDIRGIAFALGVLAPGDMSWLWTRICELSAGRAIAGGDSACGFANTAMQLAGQRLLPEVLAAVVRAMSSVRSLVAFEAGAVGPSKDCAYEGPVMKAIAGVPISMEGKSASCAHFSPIGNVAAAVCDLWSNESVQNVRLLSGSAPEAYTELLAYDCRLMNVAAAHGEARRLRDWMTESDEWLSPQAAVLSPAATIRIAQAIVAESDPYRRTVAAGRAAIAILRQPQMLLARKELHWLDRIEREFTELPTDGSDLLAEMLEQYPHLNLSNYDLSLGSGPDPR
jgi:methanol--5-hydroxybenzimidazolylcobamide Co-methyltransferase